MTNFTKCDYKQCGKEIEKNHGYSFYNCDFSKEGENYDFCDEHGLLIKREIIGEQP